MFLTIFLTTIFTFVNCAHIIEPKFQVLTPYELMVEVPHYENFELVTFRIGVKRANQETEDLELGENDISNSRIFIYDQRLNLNKNDTVNYLLAFKGRNGYQAQTGRYIFDGVYYKKPFGRRHRFRRHLSTTTEKSEYNTEEDTEEFDPAEPRFGFHPHQPRRHWHNHGPPQGGFNPFGHPHGHPPFSPQFPPNHQPPPFGPPAFGGDCNDHRHDMCHNNRPDNGRWESGTTVSPKGTYGDVEYHCKICKKYNPQMDSTTLRTTSTTAEDSPDIDIRFAD